MNVGTIKERDVIYHMHAIMPNLEYKPLLRIALVYNIFLKTGTKIHVTP